MGSCESKTINDAEIVVDTTRPGWLRVLVLLVVDEEEVHTEPYPSEASCMMRAYVEMKFHSKVRPLGRRPSFGV